MELTLALCIAATILFLTIYWLSTKQKNLPPGPYGLPIVGYFPFMSSKPYIDLQKLAKRYGPVFRVRLGLQDVIVLCDYNSTKAAFAQDAFMGRPPESPFDITKENLETGAFNGLPWKEQRRFSLHILRDLGFGKSQMEELLKEEIQELLKFFEPFEGKPSLLRPILSSSMSNNIATLVFGKRMKYDDPERKMLDNILNETAAAAGQTAWTIFFPPICKFLKYFNLGGIAKSGKANQTFRKYVRQQIKEHEDTLDENNIRDFIDGYLVEIKKRNDKAFCKPVLEDMVGTFFGAGSETVRLTVDWLLLTMSVYTDVQEKVYEEIVRVIGPDSSITWNDHSKLPYTQATIMELIRWRTIVPLNVLRYTLWDSELNGYFIPKENYVIANLWDIHHNPQYWGEDAEEFRVERFLSEDGKELKKSDYFIPFSTGKRQCPGESFAKTEVFLYFVSILQKFKLTFPPSRVPDFEGQLGIGLIPKPQELILTRRK